MAKPVHRIEYRPLSKIQAAKRNPKKHDVDGIVASLRRYGFVAPLIEDAGTGRIVAGHGRDEALRQMKADGESPPDRISVAKDGDWLVPVVAGVAFASEQVAEEYLIADNQWTILGGWKEEDLAPMLADLAKNAVAPADMLLATGFSQEKMDRMLSALQPVAAAGDDTAKIKRSFSIIIECSGEKEQLRLLKRFQREGIKCRALT